MIFFLCINANAQEKQPILKNIVPNPGFEQYSGVPLGWFYKGVHFTSLMKYWDAATSASPDVFGPKVQVPKFWKEKGFGDQHAHGGESMVGITLYGCKDGKPHCREYIQVRLTEPMVKGQEYLVEFFTAHLAKSYRINNLGAHFSKTRIDDLTDEALNLTPQVEEKDIISLKKEEWYKFSKSFIANDAYEFLIIGNFQNDQNTQFSTTEEEEEEEQRLKYAYYYIDDILVKKLKPVIEVPEESDRFKDLIIKKGEIIQLENIYFDLDKADFLPRSFPELGKLINLMKRYPTLEIEIHGHTDNQGDPDYNDKLSLSRAKAVADYLSVNQISKHRTSYKGFGSTIPIASNETKSGRMANRRVEFLIVAE